MRILRLARRLWAGSHDIYAGFCDRHGGIFNRHGGDFDTRRARRFLWLSLFAASLAACSQQPEGASDDAGSGQEADQQQSEETNAQKIDETISPGDDFYARVNGYWLENTEIPAEFSVISNFTLAQARADGIIAEILDRAHTAPTSETEKQIGQFYASLLALPEDNMAGLSPVQEDLERINAIASIDDAVRFFSDPAQLTAMPIAMRIAPHPDAPEQYSVLLSQSGLGLFDRRNYLEAARAETLIAYQKYIGDMLTLAAMPEPDAAALQIVDFESRLAARHWSDMRRRERALVLTQTDTEALSAAAGPFPWSTLLEVRAIPAQTPLIARELEAITGIAKYIQSTELETLKRYLSFHLIHRAAPYLSQEIAQRRARFEANVLFAAPQPADPTARARALTTDALAPTLSDIFVGGQCTQEHRRAVYQLVEEIRQAAIGRITNAQSLSETARVTAREKLSAIDVKICGPAEPAAAGLGFRTEDMTAYKNAKSVTAHKWQAALSRLGTQPAPDDWHAPSYRVNAYYDPLRNRIVLPAAILGAPFFDPARSDAENYGALGAIIGHEMSHAIDDQGRLVDAAQSFRDWWTDEDERMQAILLEKIADAMPLRHNTHDDPAQHPPAPETLREAFADIRGLTLAHDAFIATHAAEDTADNATFFNAYARLWRRKSRPGTLSDPVHLPADLRVNLTVRHISAWYDTFDVTPAHDLYITPEYRTVPW